MIRFVTTNGGKALFLGSLLAPFDIEVEHLSCELSEPQTHDIERIAMAKAHEAYERFGPGVLVQDSGYELEAWPRFPGAYVKMINETIGNEGILTLVEGRSRRARFRSVWAYHDGSSVVTYDQFEEGSVALEERGVIDERSLSPLWRIHIPEHEANPGRKTLAQMGPDDHERHRAVVSDPLVRWLVDLDARQGRSTLKGRV